MTDMSQMSDDDLQAMASGNHPQANQPDFSSMSDDDLQKYASSPSAPVSPVNGTTPNQSQNNKNNPPHNSLPDQMVAYGNSPTNVDVSDLPQSHQSFQALTPDDRLKTTIKAAGRGLVGAGEDMLVKPAIGGIGELLQRAGGEYPSATETQEGGPLAPLPPNALGVLAGGSPLSAVEGRANPLLNGTAKGLETGTALATKPVISAAKGIADTASKSAQGWGFTKDAVQRDAQFLKNYTDAAYDRIDPQSAINADAVENMRQKANNAFAGVQDAIPKNSPKTSSFLEELNDAADSGQPVPLLRYKAWRSLMNGASSTDSAAASAVRDAADSHLDGLTDDDMAGGSSRDVQLLRHAQSAAARSFSYQRVADALGSAGGNPARIKSNLTRFLDDEDNTRGLNDNEISTLQQAATNNPAYRALDYVGKVGFDLHPSNPTRTLIPLSALAEWGGRNASPVGMVEGSRALGIPGLGEALVGVGTGANTLRTMLTRGDAARALETIKNRPLTPAGNSAGVGLLEQPSIKVPSGGFGPGPTSTDFNPGQKLLPRSGSDTYYQPQGRALTYQPRADWEVSPEGFAQKPSDTAPPTARPAEGAIFRRAGQNTADRNVKRLMITHQPREDFIGTNNGIIQSPAAENTDLLGTEQNMPMPLSEATKVNSKWPQQAAGGRVKRPQSGKVFKKPTSYPAIEALKRKSK